MDHVHLVFEADDGVFEYPFDFDANEFRQRGNSCALQGSGKTQAVSIDRKDVVGGSVACALSSASPNNGSWSSITSPFSTRHYKLNKEVPCSQGLTGIGQQRLSRGSFDLGVRTRQRRQHGVIIEPESAKQVRRCCELHVPT